MRNLFAVLMLLFTLSSCAFVHKMDIEQGNVVNREMVDRLRLGMTPYQVKEVMGSPMLMNTFADNRIDYVYTFKPGGGSMTERYVTLTFVNGFLRNVTGLGI